MGLMGRIGRMGLMMGFTLMLFSESSSGFSFAIYLFADAAVVE